MHHISVNFENLEHSFKMYVTNYYNNIRQKFQTQLINLKY